MYPDKHQTHSEPINPSKKPYIRPELTPILELDIANNNSGGGDGDAALAHS